MKTRLRTRARKVRTQLEQRNLWHKKPLLFGGAVFVGLALGLVAGVLLFPQNLVQQGIGRAIGSLFGLSFVGLLFGVYLGAIALLIAVRVERGDSAVQLIGAALIGLCFVWIPLIGLFIPFLLIYLGMNVSSFRIQRGTKIIDAKDLQFQLREKEKQFLKESNNSKPLPAMRIAGIEIPSYLENLGFFFVGSPGSGKTQSIVQMLGTLRERSDFRVFLLDRNGELLEKLYRPGDVIFNPSDVRSVAWSHTNEPSRAETLAAALIPDTDEPFWGESARALLSDLYERCNAPYQVWDVLSSFSLEELRKFCKGGLSSRYLENDRTGSSVLSTLANQTRFYRYLSEIEGNAFSFTKWGLSEDPRWVFLPLFEDDSELYKPLYSSAFELMLRGLLSNENRTIKTAIAIDELGALNRLRSMPRLLSESRKFGGSAILGTQTQAQVEKVYGEHDLSVLLQGTATKLILNCRDPRTSETFAQVIGQQERRDTLYGSSSSLRGSSNSTSEMIRETYAVLPSELQNLPRLEGYLKAGDDVSPAKVKVEIQAFPTVAPRLVSRQWREQQGTTPTNSIQPPATSNGNEPTQQQGLER